MEELNVKLADLIFPEITETIEDLEKRFPKRDLKEGAEVTRFAPSPTGFLHIGGLFGSLIDMRVANQSGGKFILRIEDTDKKREVENGITLLVKELKAFNINNDEGVTGEDTEIGEYGPYKQSAREYIYKVCAKELIKRGRAYPCFCTAEELDKLREAQERSKQIPGYYGTFARCRNYTQEEAIAKIEAGDKYVVRFRSLGSHMRKVKVQDIIRGKIEMAENDQDIVIIKSDGLPTYNFANVIDDHLMDITYVMRGNEYLSSTPKYNLLYEAFGWEKPRYAHLTPIMKDATRKLSKRHGDANFDDFTKKGYLPEAIINYIALLGWSPKGEQEKFTMDELIEKFSIDGLSKSSSIFDENKMYWLNGEYIKELEFDKFMEYATPFFEQSKIKGLYDYAKFGKLLQSRIGIFSEIPEKVAFITEFNQIDPETYFNKKLKIDSEVAKVVLEKTIPLIEGIDNWCEDALHEVITSTAAALEKKSGVVYTVLRIAISAHSVTPGGITELADILGKEESVKRLKQALAWLA